jgi:hypothetical protein
VYLRIRRRQGVTPLPCTNRDEVGCNYSLLRPRVPCVCFHTVELVGSATFVKKGQKGVLNEALTLRRGLPDCTTEHVYEDMSAVVRK